MLHSVIFQTNIGQTMTKILGLRIKQKVFVQTHVTNNTFITRTYTISHTLRKSFEKVYIKRRTNLTLLVYDFQCICRPTISRSSRKKEIWCYDYTKIVLNSGIDNDWNKCKSSAPAHVRTAAIRNGIDAGKTN